MKLESKINRNIKIPDGDDIIEITSQRHDAFTDIFYRFRKIDFLAQILALAVGKLHTEYYRSPPEVISDPGI